MVLGRLPRMVAMLHGVVVCSTFLAAVTMVSLIVAAMVPQVLQPPRGSRPEIIAIWSTTYILTTYYGSPTRADPLSAVQTAGKRGSSCSP